MAELRGSCAYGTMTRAGGKQPFNEGLSRRDVDLYERKQRAQDFCRDRCQRDGESGVEHDVADAVVHPDDPFPDRTRHEFTCELFKATRRLDAGLAG